jgi:hypothetical protein
MNRTFGLIKRRRSTFRQRHIPIERNGELWNLSKPVMWLVASMKKQKENRERTT